MQILSEYIQIINYDYSFCFDSSILVPSMAMNIILLNNPMAMNVGVDEIMIFH